MAADKVATFAVNLEGNAVEVSEAQAAALEKLQAEIKQNQDAIRGMGAALRNLRGSSDEVAEAKVQLRAKIDAARGAISQATLAVTKQGLSLRGLSNDTKKVRDGTKAMADGFKAGGGPLGELTGKLEALKGVASGGAGGLALVALGATVLVVGVVALTTAIIEAGVRLGKFVIEGANALRSMDLMREAASGSAENAKALGTQVDFLSRKVATSKEKINEIGVALVKSLSGGLSKANGQAIVDTFAAVTEASAAMGDEAGAAIRQVIEDGKRLGRISISPDQLRAAGLQLNEVAAALAKNLHVRFEDARIALFQGRVKLSDGAKALRDAVEARFGDINTRKLLDVDVQLAKFKEHLTGLTKGVVLEPLLKGLDTLLSKFDETTVTGQGIAAIFTKIGTAISNFAVGHLDQMVKAVETLVLWGLRAVDFFSEWIPKVVSLGEAIANSSVAMFVIKSALVGIGIIVGILAASFLPLIVAVTALGVAVTGIGAVFFGAYKLIHDIDWKGLGKWIVGALVEGLEFLGSTAVAAVVGLGTKIKNAFKSALHIGSPSRDFYDYAVGGIGAGLITGLEASGPKVQRATDEMAPKTPAPRAVESEPSAPVRGGGGGATVSQGPVIVNFQFPESVGTQKAQEIAKQIAEPSILGPLTKAIRLALVSAGIPTQAPVVP